MAANIRSLLVRPFLSADLCFQHDGIIAEFNVELGSKVTSFDFKGLLALLGTSDSQDASQLKYGAEALDAATHGARLCTTRNETIRAELSQVLLRRKIAFLERLGHIEAVDDALQKLYPTVSMPSGKLERLSALSDLVKKRRDELNSAYTMEQRTGVVKEAVSNSTSSSDRKQNDSLRPVGTRNHGYYIQHNGPSGPSRDDLEWSRNAPMYYEGTSMYDVEQSPTLRTADFIEVSKSSSNQTNTETTTSKLLDFAIPLSDALERELRAQLALQDDAFAHFIASMKAREIRPLMSAELAILDNEVRKAQVGYINSILLSPFSGTVTEVYKGVGEFVRNGEAVVRVENADKLFLVGQISMSSAVTIGQDAVVTTSAFEGKTSVTLPCKVVAVRGHSADDDEWDLIFKCDNPGLPANYHFDKNETSISFS